MKTKQKALSMNLWGFPDEVYHVLAGAGLGKVRTFDEKPGLFVEMIDVALYWNPTAQTFRICDQEDEELFRSVPLGQVAATLDYIRGERANPSASLF